jgi:hypothetical protein
MKDTKGHGSAAHQAGVAAATAPMQRRQYEAIAGAINSYPGDKAALAQHFAGALQGTNPQFNGGKFQKAAMTGNMGKTKGAAPGMSRSHYEMVANAVKGFGSSHPGAGPALADHFANELGRRNPNFNAGKFKKAAN